MYCVYSDPCGVAHCWMAGLVIKPTHVAYYASDHDV